MAGVSYNQADVVLFGEIDSRFDIIDFRGIDGVPRLISNGACSGGGCSAIRSRTGRRITVTDRTRVGL